MSDRRRDPQNPPDQDGFEGALGSERMSEEATEIVQAVDRAAALLGELLAESGPDRRRLVEEQPRFRASGTS